MGANRIIRHYASTAPEPRDRFAERNAAIIGASYIADPSNVPCPLHSRGPEGQRSPMEVLKYVDSQEPDWFRGPAVEPVGAYDVVLICQRCRRIARVSVLG